MTYSLVGTTARQTQPVGLERRLAAILSADVQGYSRLMRADEIATICTLTAYRSLMASLIQQYRGRVVDDPGDNLLAEFPSVVDAVQCAVTIQRTLAMRNAVLPRRRQMVFRMGLHLGDVEERIDELVDPVGGLVDHPHGVALFLRQGRHVLGVDDRITPRLDDLQRGSHLVGDLGHHLHPHLVELAQLVAHQVERAAKRPDLGYIPRIDPG